MTVEQFKFCLEELIFQAGEIVKFEELLERELYENENEREYYHSQLIVATFRLNLHKSKLMDKWEDNPKQKQKIRIFEPLNLSMREVDKSLPIKIVFEDYKEKKDE